MAFGELFDIVGYTAEGLAGWRYVVSANYRNKTQTRWRTQSTAEVVAEVIGYIIGIVLTIAIVVAVAFSLFRA